jgi:hypothetical protein
VAAAPPRGGPALYKHELFGRWAKMGVTLDRAGQMAGRPKDDSEENNARRPAARVLYHQRAVMVGGRLLSAIIIMPRQPGRFRTVHTPRHIAAIPTSFMDHLPYSYLSYNWMRFSFSFLFVGQAGEICHDGRRTKDRRSHSPSNRRALLPSSPPRRR